MDKKVIFAVAGSGKTSLLVKQLDLEKRTLIVTYTIRNRQNLKSKIIDKFDCMPPNIHLMTYVHFLYSFCYQPFLHMKLSTKGISFKSCNNFYAQGYARYIKDGYLYSNRIAKLLEVEKCLEEVSLRLSKYFDLILIDEIQDLAGNDFNLLNTIVQAEADMLYVGDFYQHTYDTSRDARVNENLHKDYSQYKDALESIGYVVDTKVLKKSYRCSPTVCDFVSNKLGIEIESHRKDENDIHIVDEQNKANKLFHDDSVVKLFYQESHKYKCYSNNWGNSKGEDKYSDVCVVLNKITLEKFKKNKLINLALSTKNKLYVAITRARESLYFVPHTFYDEYRIN